MYKECVIDAEASAPPGMACFCPIEGDINGDFTVVTGLNYLSTTPPPGMKLVAVVHSGGQGAVEKWCENNRELLDNIKRERK
jgi:hypothetical protein